MPRQAPTTDDPTARHFLDAAAQLIDAMFVESIGDRPRRLSSFAFPATLHWLRVDDVIALAHASGQAGVSRKAFHNRWPTKDEFLRDAVIHTMLYRDNPDADPTSDATMIVALATTAHASLSTAIALVAERMMDGLLSHPRAFLLLHLGPVLSQHPILQRSISERMQETLAPWFAAYEQVINDLELRLRPGWTVQGMGFAITAMLDGFLLRSRLHGETLKSLGWDDRSLFAQTVTSFVLGVIDADGSGEPASNALDRAVVER